MWIYALTTFLGAFLLFQVQPLIAKFILPWFGGAPSVWTTCMLFFQAILLVGYAYAHFVSIWLKGRTGVVVHFILLIGAVAVLPIIPRDSWKPDGNGNPNLQILVVLLVSIGLPYFVLSSTGPLIQQWFSRTHPGVSPYRLYALSNIGSLVALLSYPFYIEAHFTRRTQAVGWGWGLIFYSICSIYCGAKLWNWRPESDPTPAATTERKVANSPLRWFTCVLLSACGSILLLSTTNFLCQDMAVVPFLWIAPLTLYLLSFVICFDSPRWYVRFPFALALIVGSAAICLGIYKSYSWPIWKLSILFCGGLFACCMVCHGEIYRLRPATEHLTRYYLAIAFGGVLGGLLVVLVAPLIFTGYLELHFGLLLCTLLFLIVYVRDRNPAEQKQWRRLASVMPLIGLGGIIWLLAYLNEENKGATKGLFVSLGVGAFALAAVIIVGGLRLRIHSIGTDNLFTKAVLLLAPWTTPNRSARFRRWHTVACVWLSVGFITLATTLWLQRERHVETILESSRNFYGVLRVFDIPGDKPKEHYKGLAHGRVSHGLQFVDRDLEMLPTLYYGKHSGVGLALDSLPAGPRRLGLVGLGVGTLTSYARPQDNVRIYEINPAVVRIAKSQFTYLSKCPAKLEMVLGDARLALEKEPDQQFDLLALDAFNGDAIPVHLLTRECFQLYRRHMQTNGVIALHISNRYLDLDPVVLNAAAELGYKTAIVDSNPRDDEPGTGRAVWVLLTHNEEILRLPAIRASTVAPNPNAPRIPVWTDDFASLLQILK